MYAARKSLNIKKYTPFDDQDFTAVSSWARPIKNNGIPLRRAVRIREFIFIRVISVPIINLSASPIKLKAFFFPHTVGLGV